MTTTSASTARVKLPPASVLRVGFFAALVTTVITLVTFGFAITAVPISGANCLADCFEYPYLDTISQFPKDYIWMPLAILMILAYVVLMVSIQAYASRDRKIFGQIGLAFAIMAALILLGDYFVQFSVVPVSLMHGETEGITLLTQYNSHGPFIVLEELGYLIDGALVLVHRTRVRRKEPPGGSHPLDPDHRFRPGHGLPGSDLLQPWLEPARSLRSDHHLHRLAGAGHQWHPLGLLFKKRLKAAG